MTAPGPPEQFHISFYMGLLKAITGRVDLDGSGFERGAVKVEKAAEHLAHKVVHELSGAALEAFGAFEAGNLVRGIVESIAKIHRLSEEFRVSTDTIQKWDKAAEKIGEDASMIGEAFNRTKKARDAALGGDVKIAEAFGKFGVSMEDLADASKDTEEIINQIVSSVAGRRILDDEDVAGMEIFGKSGAKVLSAFEQLHALGPVKLIDERDIANMTRIEREWKETLATVKTGAAGILGTIHDAVAAGAAHLGAMAGGATWDEADDIVARQVLGAGAESKKPAHGEEQHHHLTVQAADPKATAQKLKDLDAERLELAKKISENQMAAMTSTEREAALKEQIAHFEDEATRQMIQGNDLAALKAAREAETLRTRLMADQKKGGKDLQVDSLNKIGVFVGGAENVLGSVAKDQLHVLLNTQTVAEKILQQITKSNHLGNDGPGIL